MKLEEAASNADRIAVFIHGVAEASGFTEMVRTGLMRNSDLEPNKIVSFAEWVTESEKTSWKVQGFEVVHDDRTHLLIGFDWCDARPRFQRQTKPDWFQDSQWRFHDRLDDFWATMWSSLEAVGDTMRTLRQVGSVWAALLVVIASIVLLPVSLLFLMSRVAMIVTHLLAFLAIAQFYEWKIPWNAGFWLYLVWVVGYGIIAGITFAFHYLYAQHFDTLLDAPIFVSDPERRIRLQEEFASMLRRLSKLSGGKPILVVAHSLGSVLASHALAQADDVDEITLFTIGSPLGYIGRVYPKAFKLPLEIKRDLKGRIRMWLNGYREGDGVSRGLMPDDPPFYREFPLGWGGHGNYFGAATFWQVMDALSRRGDLPSFRIPAVQGQERMATFAILLVVPLVALFDWALAYRLGSYFAGEERVSSWSQGAALVSEGLLIISLLATAAAWMNCVLSRSVFDAVRSTRRFRGPMIWTLAGAAGLQITVLLTAYWTFR